jgi:hypothetical protein
MRKHAGPCADGEGRTEGDKEEPKGEEPKEPKGTDRGGTEGYRRVPKGTEGDRQNRHLHFHDECTTHLRPLRHIAAAPPADSKLQRRHLR